MASSNPYEPPRTVQVPHRRALKLAWPLLCMLWGVLGANVPVMFWAARHFLHPDRHVFAAKVTVVGALLGAIVGFLVCSRLAMRGAYWWGLLVAAIVWLVVFPKQ